MPELPTLTEFKIETAPNQVIHLVFDAPGRSMNVFSNAAILELARFAAWLKTADVAGVVVRSAKPAFCAGADLAELGAAYDMIMAAPKPDRFRVAYDHFFALSQALRALETCGKPVSAAIGGLALGGGCELALGCHYRVMADSPAAALGLPESLVGLLPGAGGTQRLPRLIGIEAALPVLLDGKRLTPTEALARGAVHQLAPPGEEVAAAERWVLAAPTVRQPWDEPDWRAADAETVGAAIAPLRARMMAQTRGHYPAPLAILDCLEQGLPQPMDRAIETEMTVFSGLIQRPEPRDMIRSLFHGKQDYDRRLRRDDLPAATAHIEASVAVALAKAVAGAHAGGLDEAEIVDALAEAGFTKAVAGLPPPDPSRLGSVAEPPRLALAQSFVVASAQAVAPYAAILGDADQRVVDYALILRLGFPAFLGGPFALLEQLGDAQPQTAFEARP